MILTASTIQQAVGCTAAVAAQWAQSLTREQQQQARRLAAAGAREGALIKEALEPRKSPMPRPRHLTQWRRA
ncbi:hypothetical protein [Stenotrophomonas maltophilia]|nr:hypothetical protein [Stenotrophomonas maltophilia]